MKMTFADVWEGIMKKSGKIIAVILAIVAVLLFSACNKEAKLEISDDGYWIIDGEKSNIKAKGDDGAQGPIGEKGDKGDPGDDGTEIDIRTVVLRDSVGNIVTSDAFPVDSIIDVKGIVLAYNGSYQVKVFSINDVTFK